MLTVLGGTRCQVRFRETKRGRTLEVAWMWVDLTWLDGGQLEQAGDRELFWGPLGMSSESLNI